MSPNETGSNMRAGIWELCASTRDSPDTTDIERRFVKSVVHPFYFQEDESGTGLFDDESV